MQILGWILAFATAFGAGIGVYRTEKQRGHRKAGWMALLRGLLILFTWLLLLAPMFSAQQNLYRTPTAIMLIDDSRSAGAALKTDSLAFRQKMTALQQALGKEVRLLPLSFSTAVRQGFAFNYTGNATNISDGLKAAAERAGKAKPSFVIMATDGRANAGPSAAYEPPAFEGALHLLALGDSTIAKDLRIGRIYAPRTVAKGAQFEVRADFYADGVDGLSGNVNLQNSAGQRLGSNAFTATGSRYDRSVSFTLSAERSGIFGYQIATAAVEGEQNTQNNSRRFYVEVVEQKKKILLAAAAPHPDMKAIREALSTVDNYELTVRTGATIPPEGYDVAILHGLPASGSNAVARKPVWYIVGASTNLAALNAAQKAAFFNGPSGGGRPAYAKVVNAFDLFTSPAGLAALTDRLPPLFLPQAAVSAAPDAKVFLTQKENNQPLWLLRNGSPLTAVMAGEGLWRWRLSEYRQRKQHGMVDECIRQTVAFLVSGNADRRFRLEMPKWEWSDGEGVSLQGYLLNAAGQAGNVADVSVTLTDSAGRNRTYQMERAGTGYRLNFGTLLPGTYRYSGRATAEGKTYTDGGSFVVQEMPLELLETGADYPFLHQLAARYEGTVRPWQNADQLLIELKRSDALKPRLETLNEPRPLIDQKWIFFLILLIATAEWLLRRYWT